MVNLLILTVNPVVAAYLAGGIISYQHIDEPIGQIMSGMWVISTILYGIFAVLLLRGTPVSRRR